MTVMALVKKSPSKRDKIWLFAPTSIGMTKGMMFAHVDL